MNDNRGHKQGLLNNGYEDVVPMVNQGKQLWIPQSGFQINFLSCPVYEILGEGSRGSGKSDCLLMDFAKYVGTGFGASWRGIIFRQSYPQLTEIVVKSKKWFHLIFPTAKFNQSGYTWSFEDGEQLMFRYIETADDYWNYHGWEIPWIGWEELVTWADAECYETMKSICRSSHPGIPKRYASTTNPFGVGMNWVKTYFIDPAPAGTIIENENGEQRVRIRALLHENKVLMDADPDYPKRIASKANPAKRKAWLYGDWDIISGGAIDDVWNPEIHIIKPFKIPSSWYVDRSMDWGSTAPFSIGWWAESDGTPAIYPDGEKIYYPAGTLFRIAEFYGGTLEKPNEGNRMLATEVAKEILKIEKSFDFRVNIGRADPSIFTNNDGTSIAKKMSQMGVLWKKGDNTSGSRVSGLELVRDYLSNSINYPTEKKGLYIFNNCRFFIKTVPMLPRDEKKPDDVDTRVADHVYDDTRYKLFYKRREFKLSTIGGV